MTSQNRDIKHDIQFPGIKPGFYQHIAREPNTNYLAHTTLFSQKKRAEEQSQRAAKIDQYAKDTMLQRYEKHAAKKQFQRLVREKVQKKMESYEEEIEQRRKKLQELLFNEERQFYFETVEQAQKNDDFLMEGKKQRVELLRAKREEERLAVVHQKRIEQYRDRCQELRPSLAKKHLIETKNTQLQQIRENEARREANRELDRMWHHLTLKDMQAKMEREEQQSLKEKMKQIHLLETWSKQVKGKNVLKNEKERLVQEDKIEMDKLQQQLRREEIEAMDAKRRKRDQTAKDLLNQIAEQEMFLKTRKEEEKAYTDAFVKMATLEMEKEKQAAQDFTTQARRETVLYKNYLRELEEERKKEEQELEKLLVIHRKEIEKKQDEARCKLVEAKRALAENVLQERAHQIAYKKQEAEQELTLREADNELLKMAFEQNERLQAESDRLESEAVKQYRDDLKKQIEFNNVLRERERQELERQLKEGMKEEEKYRKIVEEMVSKNVECNQSHPFRRVLERYDCYCNYP